MGFTKLLNSSSDSPDDFQHPGEERARSSESIRLSRIRGRRQLAVAAPAGAAPLWIAYPKLRHSVSIAYAATDTTLWKRRETKLSGVDSFPSGRCLTRVMTDEMAIRARYHTLRSGLDERGRRLFAAAESLAAGFGPARYGT